MCPKCEIRHPIITAGAETARQANPALEKRVSALRTDVESKTRIVVDRVKQDLREGDAILSDPIRILQLSDLHLRGGESAVTLVQPLVTDLRSVLNVQRIDYLVICGDLADKCSEAGFRAALDFLSELREELKLSPERSILVPGNHDLKHEIASFNMQEVAGDDSVPQGAIYLVPNAGAYPRRFRFFADCYRGFKLSDYPLDPAKQGIVTPFQDAKIQFLALNSAWRIDRFRPKRWGLIRKR